MTDIASWLSARLRPDHDLDLPELRELAGSIAAEQALWRSHVRHDADVRLRAQQ